MKILPKKSEGIKIFSFVIVKHEKLQHFHERSCNCLPFIKQDLVFLVECTDRSYKIMINVKNFLTIFMILQNRTKYFVKNNIMHDLVMLYKIETEIFIRLVIYQIHVNHLID